MGINSSKNLKHEMSLVQQDPPLRKSALNCKILKKCYKTMTLLNWKSFYVLLCVKYIIDTILLRKYLFKLKTKVRIIQ